MANNAITIQITRLTGQKSHQIRNYFQMTASLTLILNLIDWISYLQR